MRVIARLWIAALCVLLANTAVAQDQGSRPGVIVYGVVMDSLASAPLPGAIVSLTADETGATARSVQTDPSGRYRFADVSEGRYSLAFHHPVLNSLGLAPIRRMIPVGAETPIQADLAIPGPRRLQAIHCGTSSASTGDGFLVGTVRRGEDGVPAPGATVVAQWTDISFDGRELTSQRDGRLTETRTDGWFVLCDLPAQGTVVLSAHGGSENTDSVEAQIPSTGFMRRDLFIGGVQGRSPAGSAGVGSNIPRSGTARLAGNVLQVEGGGPVPGARLRIGNGEVAWSNDRGEWTLAGVPYGTRAIDVRAEGFEPVRLTVDVTADAPPVRIALHPRVIPLAPVHVVGTRMPGLTWSGFEARRRSHGGRFITAADIERLRYFNVSDVLETIPGLQRERSMEGRQLFMRGLFSDRCVPAVFLNGTMMRNLSADELDSLVLPRDVAGVEIYSPPHVPAEFVVSLGECGSIVIWTR